MRQERWQQVEELFHGALLLQASRRTAYLQESCSGDTALLLEVERLLLRYSEADSFLESPALEFVEPFFEPDPETQPLDGQLISHYRVIRKIGRGGMGVVYEGEDLLLKRRVALKFLPQKLSRDPDALVRFQTEARAASSLNHPNICTIYEVVDHFAQPAIVMELLEGQNLTHRIRTGPVPLNELIHLGAQATDALAAAHRNGIVHRDIKPANMFLSAEGRLKLLDFGIAKLTPVAGEITLPVTSTGRIAGTISYMSPEQIRGEDLDGRSDLFSLGVVLYELATGKHPFVGSHLALTAAAVLHEVVPKPSTLIPGLSSRLDRVIARLLEKDRKQRYQQASDVTADLRLVGVHSVRPSRRRSMIAGLIAASALACAGGVMLYRSYPASILTGKDKLVLAEFVNMTGDPVFDGTLRQGLAVQLEQSPYLSLISDERMSQTLHLMQQPAAARLTPELAREVCQRLASAAVLEGSIASLGSQYVLGFRANACSSGELLDHQQLQVAKKEDVLHGLSKIAEAFRAHAGESLSSLRHHNVPLEEATTPSLEALKAYTTAWNSSSTLGPVEILPLLRRAISLDGEFAMAHALLARTYGDIWESELAGQSIRKAYQLRDRTTDLEKFFITVNYHLEATRNMEKAVETAQLWAQTYPRDVRPHAFLSDLHQNFGHYRKAQEEGINSIDLDPDFTPGYMNLAWAYVFLERPDEGSSVLDQAAKRKLYMPEMLVARFYIAFLKGDTAGMAKLKAQSVDKPAGEDWMDHQQATVAAYYGHSREAGRLSSSASLLALNANEKERAGVYQAATAVREAFFGNFQSAGRLADAALKTSSGRDVKWGAALAFALAADFPRASLLQGDLEKHFPEDTCVRFTYLPILRAITALHRGRPAEALDLLRVASPFDLAVPGSWSGFFGNMYPVYFRGLAYLADGQSTAAAAEFQKMLDHPGLMFADPAFALVHLQMARAQTKIGDRPRAKAAYSNFFKLWKNADPDLPILKRARLEYAGLT